MGKRAGIYTRVSTEKQGEEGYSLDTQLEACRRYIADHQWQIALDLEGNPVEISDRASGSGLDRPGLERLRDMVADGLLDAVVVYDVDRLAREAGLVYLLEKEFQKGGAEVHYVLTPYDSTPSGKLLRQIKAALAEHDRMSIIERLRRGKRGKARRGQVLGGGSAPYGYRFVQDSEGRTVNFEIVEEEAATVRTIFEWYVYGDGQNRPLSLHTIARRLSLQRVPTWADLRKTNYVKNKETGIWDSSVVRTILRREAYMGVWYYNRLESIGDGRRTRPKGEWIPVAVPAIVSRELWEAAQERLAKNRSRTQPNPKYQYLLSGHLRCGHCGCALIGRSYYRGGLLYQYYACRGNAVDRGKDFVHRRCEMPSVRAERVDELVWNRIRDLLCDPRCLLEGLQAQAQEAEEAVKPLRRELVAVEEAISDQDAKLKRLLDAYLLDRLPKELLIEKQQELERQKASLERRRNDLLARLNTAVISKETIASLEAFCHQVAEGLARVTLEDKRHILDLLSVEGIVEWTGHGHTLKINGYFPQEVLTVEATVFNAPGFYVTDNRKDGGGEKTKEMDKKEAAD
ncbi:MAG: recombinase family protein [candidate division WOR-3 bacterium]